jgi:hypothetical protein
MALQTLARLRGQWEALKASGLTDAQVREAMDAILAALTESGPGAANEVFRSRTTAAGRIAGMRWLGEFLAEVS